MLIQTNIRELARGLKAVSLAMGGGKHDAMLLDVRDGELRLVASDGHWIAEWSCELAGPDKCVALDGRSLRIALPAVAGFAASSDAGLVGLTLNIGDAVRVDHVLGAIEMRTVSVGALPFANNYTNHTRPATYPPPTAWWAGSTRYMEKVSQAFCEASQEKYAALLFRCGGERDPVYVTSAEVPSLRVALMPVGIVGRTDFDAPKR